MQTESAATKGRIDTPSLQLAWSQVPWDASVFGFPVLQLDRIEIRGPNPLQEMEEFHRVRDQMGCGFVSCRLPHQRLTESMLLEDVGFRFVEMLYQPELVDLPLADTHGEPGLTVTPGTAGDLPEVLDVAGKAFGNERIHMDPRLPSALGDLRYQNWVRSTLVHPTQRLQVLRDGPDLVAFFVTENLADGTCHWHLNAVAPPVQGRGYGLIAWRTMLAVARGAGASRVRTSVVARNHRVLNLYASLGFRFAPPSMTFHWVRDA